MSFKQFLLVLVAFSHSLSFSHPKQPHLIFDFGGVLFKTQKLKTAFEIVGISKFIENMIVGNSVKPNIIRKRLFAFLDLVEPQRTNEVITYDEENNRIPQCMCDLHAGKITMKKLYTKIEKTSDSYSDFFSGEAEKKLILSLLDMMFHPKKFIKSQKIISKTLSFIKKQKKAGSKIYALSNWDAESGELLQKEFELNQYFDDIILSGDVGHIKPDPAIYKTLLEKHNLNPDDCIFFDDRPENIEAARALGIHGVPFDKKLTRDNLHMIVNSWKLSKNNFSNISEDYDFSL